MKRFLFLTIVVAIVLSMMIHTYAISSDYTQYVIDNKTIIFEVDSQITETGKQKIINTIIGEENDPDPCGYICGLLHDYTTESVMAITHKVQEAQPRCLMEIYEIGECTRCRHTYVERLSAQPMSCCP